MPGKRETVNTGNNLDLDLRMIYLMWLSSSQKWNLGKTQQNDLKARKNQKMKTWKIGNLMPINWHKMQSTPFELLLHPLKIKGHFKWG